MVTAVIGQERLPTAELHKWKIEFCQVLVLYTLTKLMNAREPPRSSRKTASIPTA
jgi:hypothetical protein